MFNERRDMSGYRSVQNFNFRQPRKQIDGPAGYIIATVICMAFLMPWCSLLNVYSIDGFSLLFARQCEIYNFIPITITALGIFDIAIRHLECDKKAHVAIGVITLILTCVFFNSLDGMYVTAELGPVATFIASIALIVFSVFEIRRA